MKKNIFLTVFAIAFICFSANAQETIQQTTNKTEFKKEVFTVYGNCKMCKKTIESSLKNVDGVKRATWNQKTNQMTVSFNPEVITLDAIKQKIADVGYDSDTHRANDKVYNKLPGCCQYERPQKN